jgi:hypothetical protein
MHLNFLIKKIEKVKVYIKINKKGKSPEYNSC